MKTNLNGINRVRFCDYSEHKEGKSNNGGCYGFWNEYNRTKNGFKISYGTTSDFDFCPCCGSFNDHRAKDDDSDIWESGYTCGNFDIITEVELLKKINEFEETKEHYVEYK